MFRGIFAQRSQARSCELYNFTLTGQTIVAIRPGEMSSELGDMGLGASRKSSKRPKGVHY